MTKVTRKRYVNRRTVMVKHQGEGLELISSALLGTTGGALIGSSFGMVGSIVGGIVGGLVTGYSGYKDTRTVILHKKRKTTA